jgi:hypothetical protein
MAATLILTTQRGTEKGTQHLKKELHPLSSHCLLRLAPCEVQKIWVTCYSTCNVCGASAQRPSVIETGTD